MTETLTAELLCDLKHFNNQKKLQKKLQNLINTIRITCEECDFDAAKQVFDKIYYCLNQYYESGLVPFDIWNEMQSFTKEVELRVKYLAYECPCPTQPRKNLINKIRDEEQEIFTILNKLETCLFTCKNNDMYYYTALA